MIPSLCPSNESSINVVWTGFPEIFSYSMRSSIHTTSIILVITSFKDGTGLFNMLADFLAISGRIFVIRSNFSRVFFRLTFLCMWRCTFLAHSLNASLISFSISGISAIASLLSDVNGIRVEDKWAKKIAGPVGIPFPDGWSRPYLLQSIEETAAVVAQPPCWYNSGTRFAKRNNLTDLSFGRLPP